MVGEHRKKHHFNLVDIFLILVIILSIVGIALRSNLEAAFVTETVDLSLTCRITNSDIDGIDEHLDKNSVFYLADGTLLGTCKSVDKTAGTIVIQCSAEAGNSVYMLGGTKISCNRTLDIHTSLLSLEILVLEITQN